MFKKMFPRMPGGCRHQETLENLVVDKCYGRFSDMFFNIVLKTCFAWNHPKKICQTGFKRDDLINEFGIKKGRPRFVPKN